MTNQVSKKAMLGDVKIVRKCNSPYLSPLENLLEIVCAFVYVSKGSYTDFRGLVMYVTTSDENPTAPRGQSSKKFALRKKLGA